MQTFSRNLFYLSSEGEYAKTSDGVMFRSGTGEHATTAGVRYNGSWVEDKMNGRGRFEVRGHKPCAGGGRAGGSLQPLTESHFEGEKCDAKLRTFSGTEGRRSRRLQVRPVLDPLDGAMKSIPSLDSCTKPDWYFVTQVG